MVANWTTRPRGPTAITPTERKIRRRLRATRLLQAYVPLSLSGKLLEAAIARAPLPADVTREAVSANGVACDWLIPRTLRGDRTLLYVHGGGFVFGASPQHFTMVAYLARQTAARTLMVHHRLAPRHPFPAALDDCVTAYRWLLARGSASRDVVLAGDSAGGNLVLAAMMKLRDNGEPLPAAAVCLSPVGQLLGHGASGGYRDPLLHPRAMKKFDRSYVDGHDPADPLISPVLGDWRGLPPLLVFAGEDEILRTDAIRIVELAQAAAVDARLEIYPRMWHVWQLFPRLPETERSLHESAQFLRAHTPRA